MGNNCLKFLLATFLWLFIVLPANADTPAPIFSYPAATVGFMRDVFLEFGCDISSRVVNESQFINTDYLTKTVDWCNAENGISAIYSVGTSNPYRNNKSAVNVFDVYYAAEFMLSKNVYTADICGTRGFDFNCVYSYANRNQCNVVNRQQLSCSLAPNNDSNTNTYNQYGYAAYLIFYDENNERQVCSVLARTGNGPAATEEVYTATSPRAVCRGNECLIGPNSCGMRTVTGGAGQVRSLILTGENRGHFVDGPYERAFIEWILAAKTFQKFQTKPKVFFNVSIGYHQGNPTLYWLVSPFFKTPGPPRARNAWVTFADGRRINGFNFMENCPGCTPSTVVFTRDANTGEIISGVFTVDADGSSGRFLPDCEGYPCDIPILEYMGQADSAGFLRLIGDGYGYYVPTL